jgi:serine/threonine protein phosphatase PrpC
MMSRCPSCAEPVVLGASFCEACGAGLATAEGPAQKPQTSEVPTQVVCVNCGDDVVIGSDGYCPVCGHRQPAERDHLEPDEGFVAGVTDVGKRHHHNEDAMAFSVTPTGVAVVVCDGVSTTENSAEASQAAANAALSVLLSAEAAKPDEALIAAASAAREAVAEVPAGPSGGGNPSCTFVAALLVDDLLSVGWLGDSRAYWLGADPQLLTHDHSWANEMVASGAMELAEALQHGQAGSITRWIGVDAPDVAPSVVTFEVGAGQLVVCSDGLWNYAETAQALATNPALTASTPLQRAQRFVEFALESGGHDNVTVVIVELGGSSIDPPAPPPSEAVVTARHPGPNVADTP